MSQGADELQLQRHADKRLTCLANNVQMGETRNFMIDLRAPLTSAVVATFTWTATAAGDLNLEQQHGFLRHHVTAASRPTTT